MKTHNLITLILLLSLTACSPRVYTDVLVAFYCLSLIGGIRFYF